RVLEHQRDAPAADAFHLTLGEREQVAALELDRTGGAVARRREEIQQRLSERRLSASRRAGQAGDAGGGEIESDVRKNGRSVECHVQAANAKQCRPFYRGGMYHSKIPFPILSGGGELDCKIIAASGHKGASG